MSPGSQASDEVMGRHRSKERQLSQYRALGVSVNIEGTDFSGVVRVGLSEKGWLEPVWKW